MYLRLPTGANVLGAAMVLAGLHASATSLTTTSWTTWNSSTYLTGSPVELNFGPIQLTNYNSASGITLYPSGNPSMGFAFTGPDNGAFSLRGTTYQRVSSLEGASDAGASIKVATPGAGINAMILSFVSTGSTPLTLTFSDGESFNVSSGLFGISMSHDFNWFSLSTTAGSQALIDDLYYGVSVLPQDAPSVPVTSIPEPSYPWLLLTGSSLILVASKRRFGGKSGAKEPSSLDQSSLQDNLPHPKTSTQ